MQPLLVSAESRARMVYEAIKAGAVGFVPKEASSESLIDAIRIASHGSIYLPASALNELVSDALDHKFDEVLSLQAAYPLLPPQQIDALICTVKVQSNKLIARSLSISDGTVKQHLKAIYCELCVGSRTEAIYLLASRGVKVF